VRECGGASSRLFVESLQNLIDTRCTSAVEAHRPDWWAAQRFEERERIVVNARERHEAVFYLSPLCTRGINVDVLRIPGKESMPCV